MKEVLDQDQPIEIDFTKSVISQDDLLDIASNGMVFSFEIRKDEKEQPYLVAYFGANSIQYRVPRITAFVKCPMHGTVQQSIDFIELLSSKVTVSWEEGIRQDKINARDLLTE